ncbi:MAG: hypothetical protein H3C47_03310 [Candidatus Cloacimonetes bacterium]|nr:hypothetical protein [Candidatus Cloacimonadota bacterium]
MSTRIRTNSFWGFSLVEVCIAIAVLSLMVTVLYFGLGSARQQKQSGDRQVQLQQVSAQFLALLRKDLRTALAVDVSDDALMIRTGRETIAWMREGNDIRRIDENVKPQILSFQSGLGMNQILNISMTPDSRGLLQVSISVNQDNQTVFQIQEKIQIPQRGEGGL